METRLNVLAPVVEDGVLAQLDRRFVVDVECGDFDFRAKQVAKEPTEPDGLASHGRRSDVLCLARGEGNHLLFL